MKQRKPLRLPGYDYASAGAYFVTLCVHKRHCLFGTIEDSASILNDCGRMIGQWWHEIPEKYDTVDCDQFVVMPNHLHGILFIESGSATGGHAGPPLQQVIQWFKTMTTNEYIRGVRSAGWEPFDRHLWQRSFVDRVLRNDRELTAAREYIVNNPLKWSLDRNNPNNQ